MNDSFPPNSTFYLATTIGNLDGNVDLHGELPNTSLDLDDLVLTSTDEVSEHGMDCWVYECRPVRKIMRGSTKVMRVGKTRDEERSKR